MCKLFAMTNMKKVKLNSKFIGIVKDAVTAEADKDGFGYAILDKRGNVGGERTLNVETFRALRGNVNDRAVHKLSFVNKQNNVYGKINVNSAKAFVAHGRYSTNDVSLENTHPFVHKDFALFHNGVVQDAGKGVSKKDLTTTCDTEILYHYWQRKGLSDITKNVTGYYALAILESSGLLHIIRDDQAELWITHIKSIDSYMIATTPDILEEVCKKMRWNCEPPEPIVDNKHIVFNGNEVVSENDFKPRGKRSSKFSAKELGSLGKLPFVSSYTGDVDKVESEKDVLSYEASHIGSFNDDTRDTSESFSTAHEKFFSSKREEDYE